MKISAYIIAYNEAEKIRDCINSVLWADEIIVADSHSTDGTSEIAEELGAKVVHIEFDGMENYATKLFHIARVIGFLAWILMSAVQLKYEMRY